MKGSTHGLAVAPRAGHVGAEYTAPWSYEQYLCEHGLNKLLATSEQHRVVNALLNSEIPIYHGLTPALIAQIHDDDLLADFRTGLFSVYRAIPGFTPDTEFRKNLGQAEESMLAPTLQHAERAARHGFLHRAGVELLSTVFSIGAQLSVAAATGQPSLSNGLQAATGMVADRIPFKRSRDPLSIWTKRL